MLKSWRKVIEPHPDVKKGTYSQADFAADLSQVARGEGEPEYLEPVEFFRRTYITDGMRRLLVAALKRVNGSGGVPVVQIKTAFGGGKTHSMLALYHLMRGKFSDEDIPEMKGLKFSARVSSMPAVNIAVLVGTAMNPAEARVSAKYPDMRANTIWGDMALQLAEASGRPEVFEYVRSADIAGTSPGSLALKRLFDDCGSCMVLMDEIVAYARKLQTDSPIPAGNMENFITFIQEVTEAAKISRNSIVVASVPASDIETGEGAGKTALLEIEHIFERVETLWKPVAPGESFEIVKRRLFLEASDEEAIRDTAEAFSSMYNDNPGDFPADTREDTYRNRIISCYPVHPEIFDRLYGEWAALDKFQRTRGVLRFMAAAVRNMCKGNDTSPLIMPGTIPFDDDSVRKELTQCLPDGWDTVIDSEIDGKNSVPYRKDLDVPRYRDKNAARRVARTIMLGSAPASREQSVRGVEASRIRLGAIMPEENIADFNDALGTLRDTSSYLYTDSAGVRFWYDTRPNLRKKAEERAAKILNDVIDREIVARLKANIHREKPFGGVHVCPETSAGVPDEQAVRLVVLGPACEYSELRRDDNPAMTMAAKILEGYGNSPRKYRNMILFAAPDNGQLEALRKAVRSYLAWKSIEENSGELNLDAKQISEARANIKTCDTSFTAAMYAAWCWVLSPYTDREKDISAVIWDRDKLGTDGRTLPVRAAESLGKDGKLITSWGSNVLKMELDGLLWKDSGDISIKTLWEQLCTYCYLPRLAGYDVLERAVLEGVNVKEYFALADGKTGEAYTGIRLGADGVSRSSYLVKRDVALGLLEQEMPDPEDDTHTDTTQETPKPERKKTRFKMSAPVDMVKPGRKVEDIKAEVIEHLTALDGAEVRMTLEVEVTVPGGIPQDIIDTIKVNCGAMKADYHFDG